MVHEEVKGLLFPGSAGVLVSAEAAQQLDAGSVTWSVVCTVRRSRKTYLRQQTFPLNISLAVNYRLKLFKYEYCANNSEEVTDKEFLKVKIHEKLVPTCGYANRARHSA